MEKEIVTKVIQIKAFASQQAFQKWLASNHAKSPGIWIRFYKKASGKKTVVYAEALDVALCYGWIDSQSNTYDADSYIQRFTPRGKRSIWSKRNRDHISRLTKLGLMQPSGIEQVTAAQKDGRWDNAYDAPSEMKMPADFLKLVATSKKAQAFFKTLNKTNTYAIAWRLQTAKKPETRERRMKLILEMLKKGEKFH